MGQSVALPQQDGGQDGRGSAVFEPDFTAAPIITAMPAANNTSVAGHTKAAAKSSTPTELTILGHTYVAAPNAVGSGRVRRSEVLEPDFTAAATSSAEFITPTVISLQPGDADKVQDDKPVAKWRASMDN